MGSCFYQEPLVSCYYPFLRFLFFFFLIARFPDFLDLTEMPECLMLILRLE